MLETTLLTHPLEFIPYTQVTVMTQAIGGGSRPFSPEESVYQSANCPSYPSSYQNRLEPAPHVI